MAAPVSQKEYLKRYLSGSNDDKKKKKKKKKDKDNTQTKGVRVVEDSLDMNSIPFGFMDDDDGPTIAEITYEDEKMKVMEEFEANKKWKKLTDDEGNSQENIVSKNDNRKEIEDGLHRSGRYDSEGLVNRKPSRFGSDSPGKPMKYDSDTSPPRRKRHDSDASPVRKQHDSDTSPPRRKRHDSDMSSPVRKRHDSDTSPPRRKRHDSDTSPPRNKQQHSDDLVMRTQRIQTDVSPGRIIRHESENSPLRGKRQGSDTSPPRKPRHDSDSSSPPLRRKVSDLDMSPLRRNRSDSDASPPRRKRNDSDSSPPRRKRNDSDSSPPRKKIDDASKSISEAITQGEGERRPERNMTTKEYLIARKRGKLKKDTPEDSARKERESVLQKQAEEKHKQWKHGVKQTQEYQQKLTDDIHEMGKAFARTADDLDLNDRLKAVTREEDPMLEYLSQKKTKTTSNQPLKPTYKGSFPPNRLNIRPGYRWDGVDRSNGFEKRWFEHQSNKRAHDEDAYKWSVSDM